MGEVNEAANTQISRGSTIKAEEQDENILKLLDSVDDYLILVETLSSALRQGWLEMASARHSMGASRVNSVLINLQHHSAATTVEVNYDDGGSMTNSPHFTLCKYTKEKENIKEDDQSKQNSSTSRHRENQESSRESNGSETSASPRKTKSPVPKVLSMSGTLVSPKLRASQLSFETALETLIEITNTRLSIVEAHDRLEKEMNNIKES